jgi:hypothetical protein
MFFGIVLALTIGCIAFILTREALGVPRPGGLPGFIRSRGWGLLLLPVAMAAAAMAGGAPGLIPAELGLAVGVIVVAPGLAAKLVPFGLFGLAGFGAGLARTYRDGNLSEVQYLFVPAGPDAWGHWPVLAQAAALAGAGLWLLLRLDAPGAGLVRILAARWLDPRRGGIPAACGLLLIPVTGLAMLLLGPGHWFDVQAIGGLEAAVIDLAVATAALVLVFRAPAWAATLAEAGLLVLGVPTAGSSRCSGPRCPGSPTACRICTTAPCRPRSGPRLCRVPCSSPWACGWRRGSCGSVAAPSTWSSRRGPSS